MVRKHFGKHFGKQLSAYCNGELPPETSRVVAEHLLKCEKCRARYDEINLGVRLASNLPLVEAPDSIWKAIDASLDDPNSTHSRIVRQSRLPFSMGPFRLAAAAAAVLLIAATSAWFLLRQPPAPPPTPTTHVGRPTHGREPLSPWEVVARAGAPLVGDTPIEDSAILRVGEWLQTDERSSAALKIADIGQIELQPNSRLKLVATTPTEHRLTLQRGEMHATTTAPPLLFFVNTPSAEAIDYGCEYNLSVDESGGSLLRVTKGWVYLVEGNRESRVPAEAVCSASTQHGPGSPYFEDATPAFRDALARFDSASGGAEALDEILAQARPRDSLTLWHLLARVGRADRTRVYDRLAALVPPPSEVSRRGVLRLSKPDLEIWLMKLTWSW
jgi:FecR protein/Putative zinc-finger